MHFWKRMDARIKTAHDTGVDGDADESTTNLPMMVE